MLCYYAILKVGATVVPMNVLFKRHEVEYHLGDSDPVALIVWEGFRRGGRGLCAGKIVPQPDRRSAPGSTAALPDGAAARMR